MTSKYFSTGDKVLNRATLKKGTVAELPAYYNVSDDFGDVFVDWEDGGSSLEARRSLSFVDPDTGRVDA